MPAIVPIVAASLMWIWLFNPSYGLVNGALGWLFDTALAHWHRASSSASPRTRFTSRCRCGCRMRTGASRR
jgi:ABC-type sugar transport system permease subunit